MTQAKTVAKFLVALAGVAGIALAQGLVTGTAAKWLTTGIALVSALAVYVVPNTPKAP